MDIDLLKSTPDEQIEMMLMMHMDKSATEIVGGGPFLDSSMVSFASRGGASNSSMAQLFDSHPCQNSPTLLSPHNTISFSNNNSIPSTLSPNSHTSYGNVNGGTFHPSSPSSNSSSSHKQTSMAAMREMIFRIAAMQPIYIDPETVKPPKRRNVKISKDPQSVAARHRRERISERIRILQRLVPGGTKMDTASMLDEAIHYVKFLKTQVQSLERTAISNNNRPLPVSAGLGFPVAVSTGGSYFPVTSSKANYSLGSQPHARNNLAVPQQFADA